MKKNTDIQTKKIPGNPFLSAIQYTVFVITAHVLKLFQFIMLNNFLRKDKNSHLC